MKSIRKKYYLIFLFFVLLAEVSAWVVMLSPCPISAVHDQPRMDKPDFVHKVWPPPGSKISLACYERRRATPFPSLTKSPEDYPVWKDPIIEPTRGVAITINVEYLYELGIFPEFQPWRGDAFLYVDGVSRPVNGLERSLNTTVKDFDDALINASYYFDVRPILLPGKHEARIVLVAGGTTYEYTWEFTITIW